MEYTTNDLSRILDVSTNTIRRFGEMGYLSASRDEKNGYRRFDLSDVEKLMYVSKYRKVGFGHEEIAEMFRGEIGDTLRRFEERKKELDRQIAHYKALSHLLKDDIALMKRISEYGSDMIELSCSPMHYVLYQKRGELCTGGQQGLALHRFMSTCPEFEYIYLFERADVEAGRCVFSQGVAANQLFTAKYEVDTAPPVESYERYPCIMKFIRLPLDLTDREMISDEEMRGMLFGDFLDYMEAEGLVLAGDAMGIKIGYSREQDRDWQYVLMTFPVDKKHKK